MGKPNEIIAGMSVWRKFGESADTRSRSPEQRAWDSAILAASEYVRRRTGDEDLSVEIHGLLTPCITN